MTTTRDATTTTTTTRPHVALVLEQTLGHITHSANLRANLAGSPTIDPEFIEIAPDSFGFLARVPLLSNWTVRAGLQARRLLRAAQRRRPIAAMLVHTQVPAVLLGRRMVRTPTVVSLDATPLQYDRLGEFYAHEVGPARVEAWKKQANERCYARARHIITWSDWTRDSLVAEYGVPAAKITVITPGVNIDMWRHPAGRPADGPVRILFVGGDLVRKGGDLLIAAFQRMAADPALPAAELHLVTRSAVPGTPGVVVHRLGPNAPELVELYKRCDIFCLPTLGDCLPMVLSEAAAASMAIISTSVGAIHEIVRDDETGLLIPPADGAALEAALRRVVGDAALRERLGRAACELAVRRYDALANAEVIAAMLARLAAGEDVVAPDVHDR
ncbi:MAG: putative glycosyltransferase [Ilumatobacteraceae bacterium]|nr:putative glycosyltransferase [Ilumatobacteraceae bacterium]